MRINIYADMTNARIAELITMFPGMRSMILKRLGHKAKSLYRDTYTVDRGPHTLYYGPRSVTKSRKGNRYLASYRVMNNFQKVKFTSFTDNLFENDAVWKTGRRRIGRKLMTKTGYLLRPYIMPIANKAVDKILKDDAQIG